MDVTELTRVLLNTTPAGVTVFVVTPAVPAASSRKAETYRWRVRNL